MDNRNRSNVLLVEILIAVLFFMLSATVVVQVFVTAHNLTAKAGVETRALAEAQNVAEALYAADDVDEALEALAFSCSHDVWTRAEDGYTLYVEGEETPTDAGALWRGSVRAFYSMRNVDQARQEDAELFSLPCARYRGGRP
ncbi:MAG: hypothetical protein IKD53_10785 [Clostridia bacterium]|nr:hypothetical protein [Clostridia bacterium]